MITSGSRRIVFLHSSRCIYVRCVSAGTLASVWTPLYWLSSLLGVAFTFVVYYQDSVRRRAQPPRSCPLLRHGQARACYLLLPYSVPGNVSEACTV